MGPPEITVGIPFRNAENTLRTAINSVLNQSLANWELVLVDDGSTDDSVEIARAFRDRRVKLYVDGEQKGLVFRLNQVARLADAPLIARMDADDLMHPERLQSQVAMLTSRPDVDVTSTPCYVIDAHDRVLGCRGVGRLAKTPYEVLKRGLWCHPAVAGRTCWFLEHPYHEGWERNEDTELWCRTIYGSHFALGSEPLLFYRVAGCSGVRKRFLSLVTKCRLVHRYGPPAQSARGFDIWLQTIAKLGLTIGSLGLSGWLSQRVGCSPLTVEQHAAAAAALDRAKAPPSFPPEIGDEVVHMRDYEIGHAA